MTSTAVRTTITDHPGGRATRRHRPRNARRTLRLVPTPSPGTQDAPDIQDTAVRLHRVDLGPWDD
ncbi:MAG: hypothetical protein ABI181_13190 [Mycobacteriaceae bacterium]